MRGAVLAGGLASRFDGRPKGLERVGGDRIFDRVVGVLQSVTGAAPVVIANAAEAPNWRPGLKVVPDTKTGCGSLGGLYTAITSGEGPVMVIAWDMPFVTEDLALALVAGADGFDAFLPESNTGPRRLEPMCAVYGPNCKTPIESMLKTEDYRAVGFHDAVKVGTLPLETVKTFGDPEKLFFNVNTADDLIKAEELWRKPG